MEPLSTFRQVAIIVAGAPLIALLCLITSTAAKNERPEPPRTYAASIPNPHDNDDVSQFTKVLGHHGTLLIRSAWRYRDVLDRFAELGWQAPAAAPLGEVDFSRQMIVCVLDCGDEGNSFSVRRLALAEKQLDLDLLMNFVVYKQRDRVRNVCKFLLVVVPASSSAKVTISTYYDGDPNADYTTPEKARLEWSTVLGAETGDVVDDLRAKIEPAAARVKNGEDIRLRFTLEHVEPMVVPRGQFGRRFPNLAVWDGKYSNGYRNHGFEVQLPNGETTFVRPKEILNWDKNVPHLVHVGLNDSYVLPAWVEGETFKSLQALSVDTTQSGVYRITGIYTELGSLTTKPDGAEELTWGGRIATNTVTVEVAK